MKDTIKQYVNFENPDKSSFPYLVLDVSEQKTDQLNTGFKIMHWHEDLQFVYVVEGTIQVRTLKESYILKSNEGVFINTNVIHRVEPDSSSHYKSIRFPAYFVTFYPGFPGKYLVDNIIENSQLELMLFSEKEAAVLSILRELIHLESNKSSNYYQYEVLVKLCQLILLLTKQVQLNIPKQQAPTDKRMLFLLKYIENHYHEEITLDDISSSVHISKSECLRYFKKYLQTTPYQYLISYRISVAAKLLSSTDMSVGDISLEVGFRQMSHFGKYFKEKTGCTPKEYRKSHGNEYNNPSEI